MSHPAPIERDAWLAAESRMASAALQVLARARRRPARVLAMAALATGALVAAWALWPPTWEAALHFRLADGIMTDPRFSPRPPRSIREYVSSVVLSRRRAEEIMRKHHLWPAYLARNPTAAVGEFRDEVRIDVSRNYFLYDRRPDDPPRSANVTISFSGPDPEQTRAVVHEIGQALLAEQSAQRSAHLAQARALFGARLEVGLARIRSLQAAIDRLGLEASRAGPREAIDLRARIAALEVQSKSAIEQTVALERRADGLSFAAAAESRGLGLGFELFDESLVAVTPRLTPLQLAARAALALAVATVLAAGVVGAFDDRIHSAADLAAHGLPLFGAVPRFPGDEVGSYRARASRRHPSP